MSVLEGKTALITGGTTGIGFATAALFLAEGARILITGQDEARLREALTKLGQGAAGIRADQASTADIDALNAWVRTQTARIDVLVLNAGVTFPAPTVDEGPDRFDAQMGINVRGPFFTVAKLADIVGDGGSIIAVTSCLDQLGMPGMAVYSATKAALRSLVRTWAAEFKDRGIRVNAVAPGPIETPIYGKLGLPPEQLGAMAGDIQSRVPLGRFGQAEEVAGPILFLAGPHATYVTGEELLVDGGWASL